MYYKTFLRVKLNSVFFTLFLCLTPAIQAISTSFQHNNVEHVSQQDRNYFDHASCGAAALMMLMKYAKKQGTLRDSDLISFRKLIDELNISKHNGVKIGDIKSFLNKNSIRYQMVSSPEENIKRNLFRSPIAIRIDENQEYGHWLVCIGYNEKGFIFLNPTYLQSVSHHKQMITYAEFNKVWAKNKQAFQLV